MRQIPGPKEINPLSLMAYRKVGVAFTLTMKRYTGTIFIGFYLPQMRHTSYTWNQMTGREAGI
jgi:hypothetical protein